MATHAVTAQTGAAMALQPRDSVSRRIAARRMADRGIELVLLAAALSSIAVTGGIIGILIYESSTFFAHVSFWEFFADTVWAPQFAEARYGILPLVAGTLVTTAVALSVALPV